MGSCDRMHAGFCAKRHTGSSDRRCTGLEADGLMCQEVHRP